MFGGAACLGEAMDAPETNMDLFYVTEVALECIKLMRLLGKSISLDLLMTLLAAPHTLPDEELLVPVDMRGSGISPGTYSSAKSMIRHLGPTATAEAFVRGRAFFLTHYDTTDYEDMPKPMMAKDYHQSLLEMSSTSSSPPLSGPEEGEEESRLDDDDDDPRSAEPPAKVRRVRGSVTLG